MTPTPIQLAHLARKDKATRNAHRANLVRDLTDKQKETLRGVTRYRPKSEGVFLSAFRGSSRTDCIKAKCLECVNLVEPIETIGGCGIEGCPLWLVRPYQGKKVE